MGRELFNWNMGKKGETTDYELFSGGVLWLELKWRDFMSAYSLAPASLVSIAQRS